MGRSYVPPWSTTRGGRRRPVDDGALDDDAPPSPRCGARAGRRGASARDGHLGRAERRDGARGLDLDRGQVLRGQRRGAPRLAAGLELGDVPLVLEGQADVVEALHEPPARVVVDLERRDDVAARHGARDEVDGHLGAGLGLEDLPDELDVLGAHDRGEQALLARVAAEDVREARREHGPEAVVLERPHGVLARGARPEVGARDEHGAGLVGVLVEHEVGVAAPRGEQRVLETRARDALEVDGRDDLVGVDVAAAQRDPDAGVGRELLHVECSLAGSQAGCSSVTGAPSSARSATDESVPRIAVAAATSGETRCVRPPLPWRPSKLRFEVDALRSPGASWSGFMPRHIEQPALRHSAPKSKNTLSRPSASACRRTRAEPGTTSTRTSSAFLRPLMTFATARRSSMRPFVHEPMNTVSTAISRSGVPGSRAMYSRARSAASRSFSSAISAGFGTAPDSGRPWPGFVPHVTNGSRSLASSTTSASKTASSSERNVFQYSTAASQSAPSGACGRPLRYSKVVSSGAIMPARAPASIDMLQIVMRASIDSERIASPRYSRT